MARRKTAGEVKPPLCILGTAPSLEQAPFGDDQIEFWGVSTVMTRKECEHLDVAFEMHPRRYWGNLAVLERLQGFKGKIYMQDHYEEIPNSVSYPYEAIRKRFYLDVMKDNLFVTNTITWMLLLAIEEGYTDISLYGVHMAHETEYGYQQASCSWALGIIHGYILQGLPYKLRIAEDSELLTARYEYGYYEPTKAMQFIERRRKGLMSGIEEGKKQAQELQRRIWKTEGAVEEAKVIFDHMAGYR